MRVFSCRLECSQENQPVKRRIPTCRRTSPRSQDAPQKRWQVLLQARLELDGADGSSAARVEDSHDARAHTIARTSDSPSPVSGENANAELLVPRSVPKLNMACAIT